MLIIAPKGMFSFEDDSPVDAMLRRIALAACDKLGTDPKSIWASKYGVEFHCPTFYMKPYCGCGHEVCPWCAECSCPDEALLFTVDGIRCTYEDWQAFFEREVGPYPSTGRVDYAELEKAWLARSVAANARREQRVNEAIACPFCVREQRGEPRENPNFCYRPLGFEVRWYKFIGRDVELRRQDGALEINLTEVEEACLDAILRA